MINLMGNRRIIMNTKDDMIQTEFGLIEPYRFKRQKLLLLKLASSLPATEPEAEEQYDSLYSLIAMMNDIQNKYIRDKEC